MISISDVNRLRGIEDPSKRGYAFEQWIRETLPWTFRPPVAFVAPSEQVDAFFEWNSWHFLVECKAKEDEITAGSHDWEDFELKVRRRSGSCIGLFCSLGRINENVYVAAENLNKTHHTTIIIASNYWDDLASHCIDIETYLRYLVSEARSKYKAKTKSIGEVINIINDQELMKKTGEAVCRSASTTFLRRHKSPHHETTYISRKIDLQVVEMANALRPSQLSKRLKSVKHGEVEFERARSRPVQIAIIRDLSGAGKTTLAVNSASERRRYLGISRAALESEIDNIAETLKKLGRRTGLSYLIMANKPIVYFIDSLDEAAFIPNKRSELKGLFRLIEDLNDQARQDDLIGYPILIVLTVRDDYWREWEPSLEGRKSRHFIKTVSRFSSEEAAEALEKYQKAFDFMLEGTISDDLADALRHPFTMHVYAEANAHAGLVNASSHLGYQVLSLFFQRKREDIGKRPIIGFDGNAMMRINSRIAMNIVERNFNNISLNAIKAIVSETEPLLFSNSEQIARLIVSEQILVKDTEYSDGFRFRHSRFIEFLVAYFVFDGLHAGKLGEFVDEINGLVAATNFVSPYNVLDNLKRIAANDPEELLKISGLFSKSKIFMSSYLIKKRASLGNCGALMREEFKSIKAATANRDPDLCWDAFFVIAAKNSEQTNEAVIDAFALAWDSSRERRDLWKLIPRLSSRQLFLNEEVLGRLIKNFTIQPWAVLLEKISRNGELAHFPKAWDDWDGDRVEATMKTKTGPDWAHLLTLLEYTKRAEPYPLGEWVDGV